MIKSAQMVLKGVNWVHNYKIGAMVLKGVNWVHNEKIRSYGLERSQLGTQYKNQVKWSWNESFWYTVIKWCHMADFIIVYHYNWVLVEDHLDLILVKWVPNWLLSRPSSPMVLKGVNCVPNDKIGANDLERSASIISFESWIFSIVYPIDSNLVKTSFAPILVNCVPY